MLQMSVSKLLDQGGGFWRFGAICNSAHYSAKAAFGLSAPDSPKARRAIRADHSGPSHTAQYSEEPSSAGIPELSAKCGFPSYFCSKWLFWAVPGGDKRESFRPDLSYQGVTIF